MIVIPFAATLFALVHSVGAIATDARVDLDFVKQRRFATRAAIGVALAQISHQIATNHVMAAMPNATASTVSTMFMKREELNIVETVIAPASAQSAQRTAEGQTSTLSRELGR